MRHQGIVLLFFLVLLLNRNKCENIASLSWRSLIKGLALGLKNCKDSPTTRKVASDIAIRNLANCLKNFSIMKLDDIMSTDVIKLMRGVKLIRTSSHIAVAATRLVGGIVKRNSFNESTESNWVRQLFQRASKLLATHALQINIYELVKEGTVSHGRHRRHRNNMMMMMVFGVTVLGSIIVPLGFQFLAVLSGKALLLAKMALLLASLNGLKRIATSGVHYGLYQVPEHLNYGYHDRGDLTPRRSYSKTFQ